MELLLYKNFSKRRNSTKQPGDADATYDVKLKEETSIENPSWEISGTVDYGWTYAKFAGHYYFITDIKLSRFNTYVISATQDVLATYKSVIGSLNTYVERSSHTYDEYIQDNAIAQTLEYAHNQVWEDELDTQDNTVFSVNTGCYAVRMAGKGMSGVYIVEPGGIDGLLEQFIGTSTSSDDLQYLLSVAWIPISWSYAQTLGTAVNQITFNSTFMVETTVPWRLVTSRIDLPVKQLNLNNETVGYTGWLGDFRDYSASWTQAKMRVLGDYYAIDPALLKGTSLYRYCSIDLVSGDVTVIVNAGSFPLVNASKHIAIERTISGTAINGRKAESDKFSIFANLAATAASAAVGNEYGAAMAVTSAANAAISAAQMTINASTYFQASSMGSNGSSTFIPYMGYIGLYITQRKPCDIPASIAGRPLYAYKTLSEIPGYIKCSGASIDGNMMENDRDSINNYLNSGFYYE